MGCHVDRIGKFGQRVAMRVSKVKEPGTLEHKEMVPRIWVEPLLGMHNGSARRVGSWFTLTSICPSRKVDSRARFLPRNLLAAGANAQQAPLLEIRRPSKRPLPRSA